jgi:hypothetical protein
MSDIVQNALRYYNCPSVDRSDYPNPHNGQVVGKQGNGENIIGFDCSGFICHVMNESGYRNDYEPTRALSGSKALTKKTEDEVLPGDLILFEGHVGIVTEYDPATFVGKFIHMSGNSRKGGKIKISDFVSDIDKYVQKFNKKIPINTSGSPFNYYGTTKPVKEFLRINNDRYSAEVDLHINGSNPLPTLRPLGVNVYRNYVLKKPKANSILAEKPRNLPIHKKPSYKSVPLRKDSYTLIKRMWGLPLTDEIDY